LASAVSLSAQFEKNVFALWWLSSEYFMRKLQTTIWPRQFSTADRLPLDVGHGSFAIHRVHLGDDAADRKRIQLSTNLLIFVREGAAILERDGLCALLQEGDACLVSPNDFQITEIPRPGISRGEVWLFFFKDRSLPAMLQRTEGIDEVVARIALPSLPFYPARRVASSLTAATAARFIKSSTDFRSIFICLLNSAGALPFAFLKHVYFGRRFQLNLFLEDNLLSSPSASVIEKRYPAGIRAFRREYSTYLGMPLDKWLFRRRMELAYSWLRSSSRPSYEVATILGYTDLRRFAGDVRRRSGFSMGDLVILQKFSPIKEADLEKLALPSWFPSTAARIYKERQRLDDSHWLNMMRVAEGDLETWSRRVLRGSAATRARTPLASRRIESVEPWREDFLELRTTTVSNVINSGAIQKWQTGESALVSIPQLARLAA
jgi:AraC-like DNA-binding protein